MTYVAYVLFLLDQKQNANDILSREPEKFRGETQLWFPWMILSDSSRAKLRGSEDTGYEAIPGAAEGQQCLWELALTMGTQ